MSASTSVGSSDTSAADQSNESSQPQTILASASSSPIPPAAAAASSSIDPADSSSSSQFNLFDVSASDDIDVDSSALMMVDDGTQDQELIDDSAVAAALDPSLLSSDLPHSSPLHTGTSNHLSVPQRGNEMILGSPSLGSAPISDHVVPDMNLDSNDSASSSSASSFHTSFLSPQPHSRLPGPALMSPFGPQASNGSSSSTSSHSTKSRTTRPRDEEEDDPMYDDDDTTVGEDDGEPHRKKQRRSIIHPASTATNDMAATSIAASAANSQPQLDEE